MHPNAIRSVGCNECGANIQRRPISPQTGKEKLYFFCDTACKAAFQRRARPISPEALRHLYEVEQKSANDIARMVGRNSKRVWEWLRDDGVETRPRGHVESLLFKTGQVSRFIGLKHTEEAKEKIRKARVADGSKGLFKPNGDHVLKGRKGKDHPSWKGGSTPVRQAFYASDEWKEACKTVWHRADAKCERCGLDHRTIDRSALSFHVHHIASFTTFPDRRADPDNLKLLCAPCHRWVHSRANTDHQFIEVEYERS